MPHSTFKRFIFLETAQLVGNLGEFVGAIAVVITLGYLAIQIRQNSKVVEAATSNSVTRSRNELNALLATHPELSEMILAGHQDPPSGPRRHLAAFDIIPIPGHLYFGPTRAQTQPEIPIFGLGRTHLLCP